MERTRRKSIKTEEKPHTNAEGAPAQKVDEGNIIELIAQMKEIYWQPDRAFATVITQKEASEPLRLPIHAVYQAFGEGEIQLRKIVDFLLTGNGKRIEAAIPVSDAERGTILVDVAAAVEGVSDEEKMVVLNFSTQSQPSSPWLSFSQQAVPAGFLVVDAQTGAIVEANAEALMLLGTTDEEPADVPWQRTPEWLQFIREVVERGTLTNRMLEVLPDKTWMMFSAQYTQGKILAIVQDVSLIQQKVKSLEQTNAGLDNFVYHASHDLRAPLRSMQGLLDLLQTETNEAERNRFVELIEGSIKRLDDFLGNLLSISRARRTAPRPLVKINFMVEIEQTISNFFHLEDHKNLEISTRVSQPYPFVSDLMQVRVILNNVISNAFKYRRYGVRKSRIKVQVQVGKKRASIKIADNGIGMAEEHLSHIFEMFYRATERSDGSGLGLYIVQETVDRLNGNIAVGSRPNRGTTFNITLPNQYLADKKK
ncbi:MAG: HAMP domain-containing sensor histidine kinase [Bacteroidota bacterium]